MSNDAILGLIASIIGGSVVAFTNHLLERKKKSAEAKKLDAEAELIKAQTTKLLMELSINSNVSTVDTDLPDGWFATGTYPDDYEVGIDRKLLYRGNASAYIKSLQSARGFGNLMQNFKADDYQGKRLRMSAYVKTESVKNWAGLWMRVDGTDKALSFDNMANSGRPIKKTTDWTKHEIVLNVPENSTQIAFGVLLNGEGQVWVNEFHFEVVDETVPVTEVTKELVTKNLRKQPINLKFEK